MSTTNEVGDRIVFYDGSPVALGTGAVYIRVKKREIASV